MTEALHTHLHRPEDLLAVREHCHHQDAALAPAVDAWLQQAEVDLDAKPWSVVEKQTVPPSGDVHDYMSLGTYWWPNPDTKDGLPYVRQDGQRNPEGEEFDSHRLHETFGRIWRLTIAGWVSDDLRFADRAVHLLRVWFLDSATRMNPHLQYAQHIPGHCDGRGIGIVDTNTFPKLLDAVAILRFLQRLPEEDVAGLNQWFADYLDWLIMSTHGRNERRYFNNHAVQYDKQVAALALATGRRDVATLVLDAVPVRRFMRQIEPDGRMPEELARTLSLTYETFNLLNFMDLSDLARNVDIDLWHHETDDGRSLGQAVRWWVDHGAADGTWTGGEQIAPANPLAICEVLRRAAIHLDSTYEASIADVAQEQPAAMGLQLTHPLASIAQSV